MYLVSIHTVHDCVGLALLASRQSSFISLIRRVYRTQLPLSYAGGELYEALPSCYNYAQYHMTLDQLAWHLGLQNLASMQVIP